jgi:hypothetical protein
MNAGTINILYYLSLIFFIYLNINLIDFTIYKTFNRSTIFLKSFDLSLFFHFSLFTVSLLTAKRICPDFIVQKRSIVTDVQFFGNTLHKARPLMKIIYLYIG